MDLACAAVSVSEVLATLLKDRDFHVESFIHQTLKVFLVVVATVMRY
jgi:hypothetical protein